MNSQITFSAIIFVAVSALSTGAYAATETDQPKAAEAAPTTAPVAKPATKKTKRHSHVDEKMHTPGSHDAAPEEKSTELKADKDKSKHYHPRDGK